MDIRVVAAMTALCIPLCAAAQQAPSNEEPPVVEDADEVIVVGVRRRFELRIEMLDAEKHVYDVFNQFNDERRFEITCATHQQTGSILKNQVCMPAFERDALSAEALDYLEAYRAFRLPDNDDYEAFSMAIPSAALIKAGEIEYQRKMRQVAEEHPEFLQALVSYVEIKQKYAAATSMATATNEEAP